MNLIRHDLMTRPESTGKPMSVLKTALIALCTLSVLSFTSHAELQDQGLNSILQIMDKAIADIVKKDPEDADYDAAVVENGVAAVTTLSRTLGTLSYSRLQCGEAGILAEFTQRVQDLPEENQDQVRDAFQKGFDKSRDETELLSEDECKRLTQSRTRDDHGDDPQVDVEEGSDTDQQVEEVVEQVELDEPRLRHLRIAELSGQLAYKTRFCEGKAVFTRDYNTFMKAIPEEYQEEVKDTYWKGYKHGKRMNPYLTTDSC
jgi:hypothetical protein